MAIVCGLDVSSTTIGIAFINDINNKLIHLSFLKPPKKDHIVKRLVETEYMIQKILKEYNPTIIALEDIARGFGSFSTPQTMMMLATFNRVVGLSCYHYVNRCPMLINVMHIRHTLKLTQELPKKEDMAGLVAKHMGMEFPFQYKNDQKIKENEDMADAIAVALTAIKDIKKLEQDISALDPNNKKHKKKLKLLKQQYKEYTGKDL